MTRFAPAPNTYNTYISSELVPANGCTGGGKRRNISSTSLTLIGSILDMEMKNRDTTCSPPWTQYK
jgi:hypothetical protein